MLVQLVETHYRSHIDELPAGGAIDFWLRECRTAVTLCELVDRFPGDAKEGADDRSLFRFAISNDPTGLEAAIQDEWAKERAVDREYWQPLLVELEQLCERRRRP